MMFIDVIYLFNWQENSQKDNFVVKPIRPGQSYSASSQVTVKGGGSVSYSSPSHLSASDKPTSNSVGGYQTVLDRLSTKGSISSTKPIKVSGGLSPTNSIRKNSGDSPSFQYPPVTNSTQSAVQRPRKTSNDNLSFQPPTSASSRRPMMQTPDNFGAFKTIKSDPHAK